MAVLDSYFLFGGQQKWSLVALDRWSSHTVIVVWEFALADSALAVFDEWSYYRGGCFGRFDRNNEYSNDIDNTKNNISMQKGISIKRNGRISDIWFWWALTTMFPDFCFIFFYFSLEGSLFSYWKKKKKNWKMNTESAVHYEGISWMNILSSNAVFEWKVFWQFRSRSSLIYCLFYAWDHLSAQKGAVMLLQIKKFFHNYITRCTMIQFTTGVDLFSWKMFFITAINLTTIF